MSPRKIIIWVLFLAVAASLYYLSDAVDQRSQKQERETNRLVRLSDPYNVATIDIGGKEMPHAIYIKRHDADHSWQMLKPVKYLADSMQVGRLISSVLEGQIKGRIDKPGDLKQFGLDPPALRLALTDRKGDKAVLLVGNLSPTKEFAYAAVPKGKEVWLVKPTLRGAIKRTVFELRDKAVMNFVVSDVKSLELDIGKQPLKLTRVKGGANAQWRFADGGQADPDAVEDLLFKVHGLMAVDFLDKGIYLDKMGLAKPSGQVILDMAGGGNKGLLIGGPVTDRDELYVRRLHGGPVMVINKKSLERLDKVTRFSLSQRRLMRFDRDAALSLSVRRGQKELKYAKQAGDWVRTEPPGDKKSGEAASLLVWDLGHVKWQKVLGSGTMLGLDKPRAVITLTLRAPAAKDKAAGTVLKHILRLGQVDKKSGFLAAQVNGDKRVFGLTKDFMDNLPKPPSKGTEGSKGK